MDKKSQQNYNMSSLFTVKRRDVFNICKYYLIGILVCYYVFSIIDFNTTIPKLLSQYWTGPPCAERDAHYARLALEPPYTYSIIEITRIIAAFFWPINIKAYVIKFFAFYMYSPYFVAPILCIESCLTVPFFLVYYL